MPTPEQLRLSLEQKAESGHSAFTRDQIADRAINEDSFMGQKIQKAIKLGITKKQALNFYAYGTANGQPPEKKQAGFFEKIAQDVQGRRVQFGEGIERYKKGEQGLGSTALQFAGRSAQAAGDMTGGLMAPLIKKAPELISKAVSGSNPLLEKAMNAGFDTLGKAVPEIMQSAPVQKAAEMYQGLDPVTRANIESGAAVGLAALDVVPGLKAAPKVIKELGDVALTGGRAGVRAVFKPKTAQELMSNLDSVVGKITQGDKVSLEAAKNTLRNVDLQGASTYKEMNQVLRENVGAIAAKQNAILDAVPDIHQLDSFAQTYKAGSQVATANPVADSMDHLQEIFLKSGRMDDYVRIKAMKETAQAEGLSARQVNDLAREYGREAPKAFNPRTGEPLTSINAQLSENTRKGVKNAARSLMPDDTTKLLDDQMSDIYDTLRNTEKAEAKVLNLVQQINQRGIVERIGRGLGRSLDLATMGGLRGFIASLFPGNVGLKKMNYLQIQSSLLKNLNKVDDLLKRIDSLEPQKAADEVLDMMKSARRLPPTNAIGQMDDVAKNVADTASSWRIPKSVKAGDVIEVPISSIKYDPRQLAEAARDIAEGAGSVTKTPIQAFDEGGIPLLSGGYHRLQEALDLGKTTISIKIIK